MRVRALLLDADDTLFDTRAAMVAAGTLAAASVWPGAGAETHRSAGVHFHADPGGHFCRYTAGVLDFESMRLLRFEEMAGSLGLPSTSGRRSRFEAAYEPAFTRSLAVFEDAGVLLEHARRLGLRLGVLTNSSSDYTRVKLEVTGLAERVGVVVTRDTLGFGKPDRRAFHHACALLGTEPGLTAYVGDDLDVDARGAAAAGLQAIWLDRRGYWDGGDVGVTVVGALSETVAMLDAHRQRTASEAPAGLAGDSGRADLGARRLGR